MPERVETDWKKRLKELGLARPRRRREGTAPRPAAAAEAPHMAAGRAGERRAAAYLEERGARILARNVRYPDGELDIVAIDGHALVFVEVKRRRGPSRGTAAESVTPLKRSRVLRAARRYLSQNAAPRAREVRFDVLAIQDEPFAIDWIQGAFDAS